MLLLPCGASITDDDADANDEVLEDHLDDCPTCGRDRDLTWRD